MLFETLDGRPFGIRPVLPIAATQPPGEPSRLDAFRAPIAVDVLAALGDADGDPELAEALDRWELSLFQNEPFRAEQLRASLRALLGETWPLRCAVLLEKDGSSRELLYARAHCARRRARRRRPLVTDAVRRTLVAALRSGPAVELVRRARSRAARPRAHDRLSAPRV